MIFDRNEKKEVIALLGAGSMGTAIVRRIADIMEKSTAIPVEMIVNDARSIDFNSLTLTILAPRTNLWIFQAVRQ